VVENGSRTGSRPAGDRPEPGSRFPSPGPSTARSRPPPGRSGTWSKLPGTYLLPVVTKALTASGFDPRPVIAAGDLQVLKATPDVNGGRGLPVPFALFLPKGEAFARAAVVNRLVTESDDQLKQQRGQYLGPGPTDEPVAAKKTPKTVRTHNVIEDQRPRPHESVGGVYGYEAIAPTDGPRPTVLRSEVHITKQSRRSPARPGSSRGNRAGGSPGPVCSACKPGRAWCSWPIETSRPTGWRRSRPGGSVNERPRDSAKSPSITRFCSENRGAGRPTSWAGSPSRKLEAISVSAVADTPLLRLLEAEVEAGDHPGRPGRDRRRRPAPGPVRVGGREPADEPTRPPGAGRGRAIGPAGRGAGGPPAGLRCLRLLGGFGGPARTTPAPRLPVARFNRSRTLLPHPLRPTE
jgi:hypothetical protein